MAAVVEHAGLLHSRAMMPRNRGRTLLVVVHAKDRVTVDSTPDRRWRRGAEYCGGAAEQREEGSSNQYAADRAKPTPTEPSPRPRPRPRLEPT